MDKNYQFYRNNNSQGAKNSCMGIPARQQDFDYLLRNNFLSEYGSEEDQYEVLYNLGILQRLDTLKKIIDAKVVQAGGVVWDVQPTSGNSDHLVSSDILYRTLLKYYTKEQIDGIVQELWDNVHQYIQDHLQVDSELSDTSENPVQNKVIKQTLEQYVKIVDLPDLIPQPDPTPTPTPTPDVQPAEIPQEIYDRIAALERQIAEDDFQKHAILTESEYNSLETKDPYTIYFIVDNKPNSGNIGIFPIILV